MNKSAFVRARVEPALKQEAEGVLYALDMTPTQAVTLLYRNLAQNRAWPLPLKLPNEETRKTLEETDQGIGLIKSKNIDELFEQIGI